MTKGEEGREVIEVGFVGQGNGPPPWAVLLVQNLVQNTLRFRESHESTNAKVPVRKKSSLSQNIFFGIVLVSHINPINLFRFMKHLFSSLALCLATIAGFAQCDPSADHIVEATSNLTFVPATLTIEQGQSVAFLNVGGNHDVNGVTNTVTQESFENPVDFSFEAVMATDEPICIGTYTFDTPGTYNYDCSIYGHAAAGMVGTITVNALPTNTVVDVIVNSPDHELLEAAVLAADLAGALSAEGPFTVFAPTDDAIGALVAALEITAEELLALETLGDILTYHVVAGEALSTSLTNGQMIATLLGPDVEVTITDDGTFINDAMVTVADIPADNGVVHVIDAVLLPPAPVTNTIWDIVEGSDVHNYLEAALLQQDLDGALNDTTVLTLFAPTDAAFEAAAAAYGTDIDGLLALPYLTDILLYHVTGGAVMSTDLSDGQVVTMLNEGTATVTIDMGVFINNAQVTGPDNTADNGVVHILDAVIQPAPPVATTIWDIVEGSPVHTYLEAALLQEGLNGALSDTTDLTLFAPTDAALEATAAALGTDIAGVLALPNLTDILLYHVTAGAVLSTDLSDGLTVSMLNDAEATITIDENGVFVNDAQVTTPDLTADNGVVHVIDGVLLPPTDGIQEAQASWTVMPNPASDEVRFAGLAAEATAVVLDLTGRQVAQLAAGNNILAVGHMAPGTYVVAVTSNGSITTSKLVVR